MADSLLDQLKARGEAFFTEVSNNLMANPTFIDMLKKGLAVKEAVDRQVAETLRNVNVATRRDISRLEARIAELEAEVGSIRTARASSSTRTASRKSGARRKTASRKAARTA